MHHLQHYSPNNLQTSMDNLRMINIINFQVINWTKFSTYYLKDFILRISLEINTATLLLLNKFPESLLVDF